MAKSSRVPPQIQAWLERACEHIPAKDKGIDGFAIVLLTKKRSRHIEVSFIDGGGAIRVDGQVVYPPPDEPA